MAVYVIGDVQGCFQSLSKLLKAINYNHQRDRLWFVGDLVNRGPQSLETLRFIRDLGDRAITVLGNHDLHLLAAHYNGTKLRSNDTLLPILEAPDCVELLEWLRFRPLIHHEIEFNFAMVHAGIYPGWTIGDACQRAKEVETALRSSQITEFLHHMYGNKPAQWNDELESIDRLRFITNVFTRMRYLKSDKSLDLSTKGAPSRLNSDEVKPWFEFKQTAIKHNRIVFGHWSTLPTNQYGSCFALDSGCLWGGRITALRIDKKTPRWFSLSCDVGTLVPRKSTR
ncbi:MAG: symmetrical bis(5'-nucleosyl)-tetraphosphatase [Gammaproteobacteria bacterium]|nr:symmetrical bis(5'-nucleosyl)-tetraphosphatase [Gammaproteobacteria bacterium]